MTQAVTSAVQGRTEEGLAWQVGGSSLSLCTIQLHIQTLITRSSGAGGDGGDRNKPTCVLRTLTATEGW